MAINCRTDLSYNNPLRILLEPFHFNTPTVNNNAALALVAPGGLMERVFPLRHDEVGRLARDCNASYKYRTPRKFVEEQGVEHLTHIPICQEALEYWDATLRFVESALKPFMVGGGGSSDDASDSGEISANGLGGEFGTEASLWEEHMREVMNVAADEVSFVELIAGCMYTVTAQHHNVGSIGFETALNTFGGTHIGTTWDEIRPSKNLQYTGFLLTALTDLNMPRVTEDLSHAYPDAGMLAASQEWQREILEISEHVKDYNKARNRPISAFDPVLFEISVAN